MKNFITLLFFISSLLVFSNSETKWKFDFGSGKVKKGYIKIDNNSLYSDQTNYGFDFSTKPQSVKFGKDPLKGDACMSDNGFYFSVNVPEGDYRVKALIGNGNTDSKTTVRGESRRLFFDNICTKKGELREIVFTTNVRYSSIDSTEKVKIKPREYNKCNWDKKLIIEFNGVNPSVCALEIEKIEDAVTVFLCGNSTVVDQDNEPWCGWGQMIPAFFNEKISFANYAESGEAANTFISSGRLKKIETKIKKGDYLFVEFGHNDQKQKGEGIGPWTSYTQNLKKYIDLARLKGATPVLVTSMHRRNFDETGKIVNTLLDYPDAVRALAKQENVALIDLNDMSKTLYETWGVENSKKAFVHYPANTFPNQKQPLQDNTHFNSYGGYELAKCVVEGIRKVLPELAANLKSSYSSFDPSKPDSFESFSLPSSPFVEIEKPDGN